MMLLKKEVDYVPQSPKKVGVMGLGLGRQGHQKGLSTSTATSSNPSGSYPLRTRSSGDRPLVAVGEGSSASIVASTVGQVDGKEGPHKWKTTEEKKELLGTMLGNVDALVEGVRKAGIWGLG